MKNQYSGLEIAIIGMSGVFPGAENIQTLWNNLAEGKDSISKFSEEEIEDESSSIVSHPNYVKANAYISNKDCFDADFFGYTPDEAGLMNPQMRVFHECVWNAIEDAGYDVSILDLKVGLFAGAGSNINWGVYSHLKNVAGLVNSFTASQLSDSTFMCSRISYLLNLQGPSIYINTACSTSLVAIQRACLSLLMRECSMAVAGGVSINNYSKKGYLYQEGMISSPDGYCRAFDKNAGGTVIGEGVGTVVLKRLADAIKDGDCIHAVIKGSAVNNDGNEKMSYTAPGVDGQYKTILKAINMAKVDSSSISYVEAHGTGTILGDPIEVEALNLAFGKSDVAYCALGSVKTNIGHLDAAAGVAGLIKTVLSLKHRQLPPSLHYSVANPKIDFDQSPFYVNTELRDWNHAGYPLRAGVSSFGIGGTNAHMILEEAPAEEPGSPGRESFLLPVSAKTSSALAGNLSRLKTYLEKHPDLLLADVAYTLQVGRSSFGFRKSVVCRNLEEALAGLSSGVASGFSQLGEKWKPRIVFMFSGQGSQYVNMCRELYEQESVFREAADNCFAIVHAQSGKDLRSVIFPDQEESSLAKLLDQTEYTQPALFVIEYALVQLLKQWGIQPDLMIGHSIGEYVAACLSGLFSLEDTLSLVIKRGELMQKVAAGAMLSISISSGSLMLLLKSRPGLSLAAVNSSELCVVSGGMDVIDSFRQELETLGYRSRLLRTSHAFHSHMMDTVLDEFGVAAGAVKYHTLTEPFISNLTGRVVNDQEVGHPGYWVRHLRETVNFSMGIEGILADKDCVLVEVGPGKSLGMLVRSNNMHNADRHKVVSLSDNMGSGRSSLGHLLEGMGRLWEWGLCVDWQGYYSGEKRKRVSLPGYAFDKHRYPVHVNSFKMISEMMHEKKVEKHKQITEWLYRPGWKLSLPKEDRAAWEKHTVLILADDQGVCEELAAIYKRDGHEVILVYSGADYKEYDGFRFELRSASSGDYVKLVQSLNEGGLFPARLIHGWGIGTVGSDNTEMSSDYFYSLVEMWKALQGYHKVSVKELVLITDGLHEVLDPLDGAALKSLSPTLLKVLSQESPGLKSSHIDFNMKDRGESLLTSLYAETQGIESGKVVSLRHGRRWEQFYDRVPLARGPEEVFKAGAVYLITGGLGGLGAGLGLELLQKRNCRIVLVGRTVLPDRESWPSILSESGASGIAEKLTRLEELEQKGDVLYLPCDICDLNAFEAVVRQVEDGFGPISGVIHAAGIIGGSSINAASDLVGSDYEQQFGPKIKGVQVLAKVFRDKSLDFCLLTSSLSAVLGGIGFGAYGPANAFMDYYVNVGQSKGELKNWLSVNLDGIDLENDQGLSISRSELLDTLEAAWRTGLHQVVVSTTPLNERMEKWVYDCHLKETTEKSITTIPKGQKLSIYSKLSPINQIEIKLINIWETFFGKTGVTIKDNFFEIGGDSLKALTVIGRIHQEFNINLSVKTFFNYPTISELGKYLVSTEDENKKTDVEPYHNIFPAIFKPYYKLTAAQRRLYFLYEFDRKSIAYNLPQSVALKGTIDKSRIEEVFLKLIERHENLRTSFIMQEGEPVQVISESPDFNLEYFIAQQDAVPAIMKGFIRPFDVSCGPLLRAGLISIAEEDHILMMDIHHIITDGVSSGILIRDFMALYNQEHLPDLRLQYKDYSEWQQGETQKNEILVQKDFWLAEFSEPFSALELPYDFSRPMVKNNTGNSIRFEINEPLTASLKSFAESEKVTLFMVMLSAYTILLSKLGNQEDIVVGVPVSGRPHAELEMMMGMFINTLPLRNYPSGEKVYREYLQELKSRTLSSFDHQSYPYESLLDELKVVRDLSHNPLFDVMFSYENFESIDLQIPGLQLKSHSLNHPISKFDLTLMVNEKNDKLYLTLEYSTELFAEKTITRFIDYFKNIVSGIIANPEKCLSEIEMLSQEEQDELLITFNDTLADYPQDKTMIDLFEEQVLKNPDYVAIVFEDQQLTYRQLQEETDRIAHYLYHQQGVKAGDFVGLMLERELYLIPFIMGILKVGAAYIPIDTAYPSDRIQTIISDSQMKTLISRPAFVKEPLNLFPGLLDADVLIYETRKVPEEKFIYKADVNSLAYVIYTSGSTGKPKGVMISHTALVNRIHWMQKEYPLTEKDVILQKTPYSFDVSVWELLWWSVVGASVCLLKPKAEKDPQEMVKAIDTHGVTVMHFVPSMLDAFLSNIKPDFEYRSLSALRYVFSSGEALKVKQVNLFKETLNHHLSVRLINLYGPTEATIDVSYYECLFENPELSIIPIGKPIDNISLHILDKQNRFVPNGVIGELYIGGTGLAMGYLHNEQLTSEKFILISSYNLGRLYKTGDLAKRLPDGNIEYHGRTDNQVKIRGFRIETGEIEYQLSAMDKIKESVVLVKERAGEQFLVAYYLSDFEIGTSELRSHLSASLPEYMIPVYYVHLQQIPVTSNGKLDRKALPEPGLNLEMDIVRPVNTIQKEILQIWSEILHMDKDRIGINMNFFDLGGNSLGIITMVNKINEKFNASISVVEMFNFPMISAITNLINSGNVFMDEDIVADEPENMNNMLGLYNNINE
ncbi:amino acid adenylation domain-containing protein [Pedobacter psychrotolerans]|uniref:amino acid adenylation domain-containing protein n=1 Tax=Pedobacter psychrotolerans TaxID=1843235 RepID=UPI003F9B51EF